MDEADDQIDCPSNWSHLFPPSPSPFSLFLSVSLSLSLSLSLFKLLYKLIAFVYSFSCLTDDYFVSFFLFFFFHCVGDSGPSPSPSPHSTFHARN